MKQINEIEELYAQLQAVANSLTGSIFVIDYDGRYVAVLGEKEPSQASARQLVGKTLQDVLPEDKWRLFLKLVRRAIDSGTLQLCEYMVDPENEAEKTASVGPRWYQGRVYPVEPKPGRPASAVWLTIDISDQKQLEQELKKLSDLDDLTGVCNRRYFLRTLENEIEIARRRSQTLSLIFLDVDYFKRINDRYGHVQGDRALQHLTRTISKHLRNRDLFARIGGEEFAILCPSTSQQEALLLAERICRTVADAPMEIKNGCIPLTISLGVASLSDSDTAIGQLLRRADQALYQAKSDGRNRACSYATFRLGQAEIAGA